MLVCHAAVSQRWFKDGLHTHRTALQFLLYNEWELGSGKHTGEPPVSSHLERHADKHHLRRTGMRNFKLMAFGLLIIGGLAGLGIAQSTMKPGHERVPPFREPSPFMSAVEIQAALDKLDPKAVAPRTGGAVNFAEGKASGVVRRRVSGPQYAVTHPRTLEYVVFTKGTGTLVTGGTLIPPTIDSDPYPNTNPDAIIRSAVGVKGGLSRKVGPGDVIVNLPGTPHWFSEIDGTIEYFEISVTNVDPAPGIERNEVLPKPATPK
jgi:hypothetical protein